MTEILTLEPGRLVAQPGAIMKTMEAAAREGLVASLPCRVGWSDIGDFRAIGDLLSGPSGKGAVAGEHLSPTQPFPTRPPPIHPAELRPEDAFGFTFWDRAKCREQIEELRSEGIFTPPSLQGTVHYPGYIGGTNWGSVATDPGRRMLVVKASW